MAEKIGNSNMYIRVDGRGPNKIYIRCMADCRNRVGPNFYECDRRNIWIGEDGQCKSRSAKATSDNKIN